MPTKKSAPLGSDSSPTRKTTRTARADTKPSTTAALATSATKEPAPVDEPTSDSLGRKATARIDAGPDLGWLLGLVVGGWLRSVAVVAGVVAGGGRSAENGSKGKEGNGVCLHLVMFVV